MKIFPLFIALLIFTPVVTAETMQEHDHAKAGGPKGGRLLENTKPPNSGDTILNWKLSMLK